MQWRVLQRSEEAHSKSINEKTLNSPSTRRREIL
jgi:hypothetical protein